MQRETFRYLPISSAAALATSCGVAWRYIRRVNSEICERSRWVSTSKPRIPATGAAGDAAGIPGATVGAGVLSAPASASLSATSWRARIDCEGVRFFLLRREKFRRFFSRRSTALACSEYCRKISTCTIRSSRACWALCSSCCGAGRSPRVPPALNPSGRVITEAAFAARARIFFRKAGSALPCSLAMRW